MTPRDLLLSAARRFREAGIPDPETDASLILSSLCGKQPLNLRLDTETILSRFVLDEFEKLAGQRLLRIPLQYLLKEAPFCGRMFQVDERVLIPRPETEELCIWALDLLKGMQSPVILDLCCGSGCIGLTIKAGRSDAAVTLADLSADALEVASVNAENLKLSVSLLRRDLLEGFSRNSFDLIVCNPPYIPSAVCSVLQPEVLCEPRMALDGGSDGLDLFRRLIPSSAGILVKGGMLLMEFGEGEAEPITALLSANGFHSVEIRRDCSGIERMALACH